METINICELAKMIHNYESCVSSGNIEWRDKWENNINEICKNLPSGSGIDAGMQIQLSASSPDKIVFFFSFHHLNENGYYTGWTDHLLIITPNLMFGFDMKITGRNKNQIKDYLYDTFIDVFTFNPDEK